MYRLVPAMMVATLVACAPVPPATQRSSDVVPMSRGDALKPADALRQGEIRVSTHRGVDDDLLTAGLRREGLLAPAPPSVAIPEAPTPAELRRRAVYANWRGIAAIASEHYAELPAVPGREFHAFVSSGDAAHPHRVAVQVPDAFDARRRCLLVAPASGSRGVYGAIAVAGPWGLPRGCAIAYTDKGAGTGFFDLDSDTGVALDGTRAPRGSAPLEYEPGKPDGLAPHHIAMKHAHSRDNPEARWGQYAIDAARFGLRALEAAFPAQAPFTAANTRIIVVGVSNGGGAALRAAELDEEGLFDAVVAGEPNILPPATRTLFDFGSEAALYQPCALLALPDAPALMPDAVWRAQSTARCATLHAVGLLAATAPAAQAREALQHLQDAGWEEGPLALSGVHLATDLWRAVLATYVQAYARADVANPVCGFSFATMDAGEAPRATTPAERALWWSDASGIAPTAGIAIAARSATDAGDPSYASLACVRALWAGSDAESLRVRASIEAVRATARPRTAHTFIVHGADDSLVPAAFTSRPYVARAREHGIAIDYLEVPRAQHFDAFLSMPVLAQRYVPLLPEVYRALDRAWAAISGE